MKNLIFYSVLFIAPSFLWADSGADGGYAGAFLRMGIEARSKSLGDAYTAVAEGPTAGIFNPAALPHLGSRQAVLSFSFLPLDRQLDFIGIALPIRPQVANTSGPHPLNAGIMIGWVHAGVSNIDGRDSAGNHTMNLSNSENAFYMGFALSPTPWMSIGIAGKILYHRIPDIAEQGGALTSRGFGLDVGIFAKPIDGLSIGAALRDNMSKYSWNTDKVYERGTSSTYKFPRILRLGAAYSIPQDWLLLVADIETSDVQNPRYHAGMEFSLEEIGSLRLGWDHDKPTFGLGLKTKILGHLTALNYAFSPTLDSLSPDHVLTWSFDF
ncbi:MAG: hypothetical protein EHM72_13375 [Calditrichaeota bacterium]|nr:MAG: hypothetical protein EHM72_13375 [Calditrichota bacterium]